MAETSTYTHGLMTRTYDTDPQPLQVDGAIPDWLTGTLIRNGPAQFEAGSQNLRHWFDGHAMLHSFTMAAGQVTYASRFLQSPAYVAAKESGRITYSEFATDPCRNIFQRVAQLFSPSSPGHNANVNLTKLAGKFIAMTETPLPVEFDPETLATVGVVEFEDQLDFVGSTAHPHYDPVLNVGVNHIIQYGRTSEYNFVFMPNESVLRRQIVTQMAVARPAYIHSFGMTENYLILAEFPHTVNPLKILLSGKPFIENFEWRPEQGTKFHVFAKADGRLVRTWQSDPFFSFHHINAFERGDDIYVDISTYDDPSLIAQLYLDRLRADGRLAWPEARRYVLAADQSQATYTLLSDHACELPRLNAKCIAHEYQYVYCTSIHPSRRGDFVNALVKIDVRGGDDVMWHEAGTYPGEPVFVASPSAVREDDGVILSVVLDGVSGRSFLLVLDAASFDELARADVAHCVPIGFHGQFFK